MEGERWSGRPPVPTMIPDSHVHPLLAPGSAADGRAKMMPRSDDTTTYVSITWPIVTDVLPLHPISGLGSKPVQ